MTTQLQLHPPTPATPAPSRLECPNPDCGSYDIKTTSSKRVHIASKVKFFRRFSTVYFWQSNLFSNLFIWTLIIGISILIRATHDSPFGLDTFYWGQLWALIGGWVFWGSIYVIAHGAAPSFKVFTHTCRRCKCKWGLYEQSYGINDKIHQWAEKEWECIKKEKEVSTKAPVLADLMDAELRLENYAAIYRLAEEAKLDYNHKSVAKNKRLLARSNNIFAVALLATDEYVNAALLVRQNRKLCQAVKYWQGQAVTLLVEGQCNFYQKFLNEAKPQLEEALILLAKMGDTINMALCLEVLADIAVDDELGVVAAQLYGAAEALRESSFSTMPTYRQASYDQHTAQLNWQLDSSVKAAAWEAGRQMSPVRAVNLAINRK